MTDEQWKEIPVGEVREGDEVKVDGYGWPNGNQGASVELEGELWCQLTCLLYDNKNCIVVAPDKIALVFRRSSITSARRKVEVVKVETCWHCDDSKDRCRCCQTVCCNCKRRLPEPPKPEPKVGEWQVELIPGEWSICLCKTGIIEADKKYHRVYRAGTGWSPDTRTGQRRVGKAREFSPAEEATVCGWAQAQGEERTQNGYRAAQFLQGDEVWLVKRSLLKCWLVSCADGEYDVHERNLDRIERRTAPVDRRAKKEGA